MIHQGKIDMSSRARMRTRDLANRIAAAVVCVLACAAFLAGCSYSSGSSFGPSPVANISVSVNDLSKVPDYSGEDYIELNGGAPSFTEEELSVEDGTEIYGELDRLGRATFAFAKVSGRTRPARGAVRDMNMPDPTGFVQVTTYPGLDHLYDRTHLIAYSLTDEATEARDLITGTMHMNQDVMTVFEQRIRDQIAENDMATYEENHVLMRVTPDFRGSELVARGVQIEALSLEDGGESICMNVYCYNIQPGVAIDYATGESRLAAGGEILAEAPANEAVAGAASAVDSAIEGSVAADEAQEYLLNTSTKRFHYPDCAGGNSAKPENRQRVAATREELIERGYKPCGSCKP